jgi:sigma-B regulation protein RsbU (phosphoserine phosphatase)
MEDFDFHSRKLQMKPGELLFLFTDGVTEAFNIHEELYGDERLVTFLQSHLLHQAEEVVKGSIQAVYEFSSGRAQSDDITLLAIRYHGNE